MTDITEARIERAARAIRHAEGINPDSDDGEGSPMWASYTSEARAALAADAPEIEAAERRGIMRGFGLATAAAKDAKKCSFHEGGDRAAIDFAIAAIDARLAELS